MSLSEHQLTALYNIQRLIDSAGLSPQHLDSFTTLSSPPSPAQIHDSKGLPPTTRLPTPAVPPARVQHTAFIASCYVPPPARYFTSEEVQQGRHRVTRKTSARKIVEHPVGAIVEYPQTGELDNEPVAHIFSVDPATFLSTHHPKASFQYSLGDGHGGRDSVECLMLKDPQGSPMYCKVLQTTCKGLKLCSARLRDDDSHHLTSRPVILASASSPSSQPPLNTAEKEVFLKTLGFFCALEERGCPFTMDDVRNDDDMTSLSSDQYMDNIDVVLDNGASCSSRRPGVKRCRGKLVMEFDKYNQPFIRCRLRSSSHTMHLMLHGLQEYDTQYLRALLENDWPVINERENTAKTAGYGPRVPCTFVASPSSQSQLCPHWHRQADSKLRRGTMRKWGSHCKATYQIFVPHDLNACPRILILCRNPHTHPPPAPVKTPPPLKALFHELLSLLHWKLADATPRRIFLDTAFIDGLHRALEWDSVAMGRDATLSDLHPSFANLDHTQRLINKMRAECYPRGTGYDGACLLAMEHAELPPEQRYVRHVETHSLGHGSEFKLIICMTTRMSQQLMDAKRISIDTSFKRAQGWQEFEIESWDVDCQRSVVGARAFTTSQTAKAHLILFQQIFKIAYADTGIPVRFRHIHGDGIESVVADSHKGQGLGLGMFCVELSRQLSTHCKYEPSRPIGDLAPCDHLRRFYRLCIAHFHRNVCALKGLVPNDDKIEGTKFALPALYQPESFIPLAIWKASPSTTNGNEQAHRNAYREGINLTLLAGIMKGMKYDQAAMVSIDTHSAFGINTRDSEATHAFRAARAVSRKGEYNVILKGIIL
ncbi:hypothetical protein BDN67DRAFT_998876 [Paxillus ammoniavirescens]|nr:hypothetical protein BDN67DRAFT_998876 [Paxillus ammoniavirescens]